MSVTQRWDIRSLTFTIQDEIGSQETKGPGVAQELYQVVGEQVVSPHSVQHCRRINTTSLNAQTVLTHCSSAEAGLTPTLLLTAHSGHALGGLLKHTKHITQRKVLSNLQSRPKQAEPWTAVLQTLYAGF